MDKSLHKINNRVACTPPKCVQQATKNLPWATIPCVGLAMLAGCSVGPDYVKPQAPVPIRYKELKGWKPATPRDTLARGPWWSIFNDKTLDRFERQIVVSNQNVKVAEASYRQAVTLIKAAQSGLFPTISQTSSGQRAHQGSGSSSSIGTTTATGSTGSTTTTSVSSQGSTYNSFTFEGTASWDLDVWGKIRRQIASDVAAAQASEADLANATLSAQAQLATAYFNLRASDSLYHLLTETAAAYQRTLTIAQNQYAAGTAARSDVATALAQLRTTQASALNVGVARAEYEHAIAVLAGRTPADVSIAVGDLGPAPPAPPVQLPSTLLERRPDIAAAERTMRQQNEAIGVAAAAFYPDVSLSGAAGFVGRSALPFSAANEIWSFGGTATTALFDGGLRLANVASATAVYDESVAAYRQTVLTAFQQVEDDLAALRILGEQARVENEAVAAARQAVDVTLNEYQAGTVAFTTVVTAQAALLGDQQTALSVRQSRFLAAVSLVEALGGGWTALNLPRGETLAASPTPPLTSPDLKSDVLTPKLHL
jgi:NodT family efflux transporter outer membrane factor (OMF) lipoprotein